MLPPRQSIFHLGEEGGAVHHRPSLVSTATTGGARRVRDRERLVVGLQILVHHSGQQHHHHGRNGHPHAANIVLKQMVTPPRAAVTAATRRAVSPCSFFLEACSLCRLELSHNKDVYMYRGDQGFCSEDCRWQQILVDETREREAEAAVVSKGHQRRGQHRHHSSHHTPIRSRMPRKTLAVA